MAMFTVALLQMAAALNDQEANLAIGLDYCREAKAAGADLALFPELALWLQTDFMIPPGLSA